MRHLVLAGWMLTGLLFVDVQQSAADEVSAMMPEKENANAQFVETTFRSICKREADPASFNYYWTVLNDESKTTAQVRSAIETSCLRRAQADPCRHIHGLDDLCQNSTN